MPIYLLSFIYIYQYGGGVSIYIYCLSNYMNSHYEYMTILYPYNGNIYTGMTAYL